ncbi:hypothetical protein [Paenibacillus durus]|nr:hypothetical protein [Paenibacillus durus]
MSKKVWEKPEVKELKVSSTEYGNLLKTTPDASYSDGVHTWYSFS